MGEEKKKITKADLEKQIVSLREQATSFTQRAQEAFGALKLAEHMLAGYEWEKEETPINVI